MLPFVKTHSDSNIRLGITVALTIKIHVWPRFLLLFRAALPLHTDIARYFHLHFTNSIPWRWQLLTQWLFDFAKCFNTLFKHYLYQPHRKS